VNNEMKSLLPEEEVDEVVMEVVFVRGGFERRDYDNRRNYDRGEGGRYGRERRDGGFRRREDFRATNRKNFALSKKEATLLVYF